MSGQRVNDSEETVADEQYLREALTNDPGFLVRNPDLLERIDVPHGEAGATSTISSGGTHVACCHAPKRNADATIA